MLRNIACLVILVTSHSACIDFKRTFNKPKSLTTAEISMGLKEALEIGVNNGVEILSKRDGYFKSEHKILLSRDARYLVNRLRAYPEYSQAEDIILEKINRAAEDAIIKAKPIFLEAISQLNFENPKDILMGADNATTNYLHSTSYYKLCNEFAPIIIESLEKYNAIRYWDTAADTARQVLSVIPVSSRLDEFVTLQAVIGLFGMIEKEEFAIRRNAEKRPSKLLRRVFAKQDFSRYWITN